MHFTTAMVSLFIASIGVVHAVDLCVVPKSAVENEGADSDHYFCNGGGGICCGNLGGNCCDWSGSDVNFEWFRVNNMDWDYTAQAYGGGGAECTDYLGGFRAGEGNGKGSYMCKNIGNVIWYGDYFYRDPNKRDLEERNATRQVVKPNRVEYRTKSGAMRQARIPQGEYQKALEMYVYGNDTALFDSYADYVEVKDLLLTEVNQLN